MQHVRSIICIAHPICLLERAEIFLYCFSFYLRLKVWYNLTQLLKSHCIEFHRKEEFLFRNRFKILIIIWIQSFRRCLPKLILNELLIYPLFSRCSQKCFKSEFYFIWFCFFFNEIPIPGLPSTGMNKKIPFSSLSLVCWTFIGFL